MIVVQVEAVLRERARDLNFDHQNAKPWRTRLFEERFKFMVQILRYIRVTGDLQRRRS